MLAKGLSRDFKLQSEILIDLLHTEGIGVRAYSSPNLPFFNKLSASEGKMIVEYIKDYTSLCLSVKASRGSLKNNVFLAQSALKAFKLTAPNVEADVIRPEHVVEIYDLNERQIFRSLNFFESTSYTIEEIYCRKWNERNFREHSIEDSIKQKIYHITSAKIIQAVKTGLPPHEIHEVASLERLSRIVDIEWIVPLTKNNTLSGIMVLSRVVTPPERKIYH